MLAIGTTAASTAPLKFQSGTSMTAAEAGAVEFTTDDLFFTITTGTARKRLLMADPSGGLTSGRVPFATTNGRLTDDSDMTFATDTLTITKVSTTNVLWAAGTTTIAPINLTAGTNLTAAVSGAVEFDGADYFLTHSDAVRTKAVSQRGAVNATAQAAAIGATTLYSPPAAGYYVVHYTLEDTT